MATLPGAWCYRVSAGIGWPGVSTLWLGEVESLICNFCLSMAARKIVWADPSLRYISMLGDVKLPTNNNISWPVTMPGKHCCWGTVRLVPDIQIDNILMLSIFPSQSFFSKLEVEVCKEWIKACGRPHEHLNPDKITKHYYVCLKVIKSFIVKQNTHFYADGDKKAAQLPHKLYLSAKAVVKANNCTWLVC